MNSGPALTPRHGARPGAGQQAADLSAVRRSDALIDLLAGRGRIGTRVLRDPAVALLRSLTADVDAASPPGRLARSRRAGRHHAPGTWPHAAAAAAAAGLAIAAAVTAVALVVAGLLGQFFCGRWHSARRRV